MDYDTVDLRKIKESRDVKKTKPKVTKIMRDIGSYSEPRSLYPDVRLADMQTPLSPKESGVNLTEQEFSNYIKEVEALKPFSRIAETREENLSKEVLADELSQIDNKDLLIKESIIKTAMRGEGAIELEAESDNLKKSNFQFIPREESEAEEIAEDVKSDGRGNEDDVSPFDFKKAEDGLSQKDEVSEPEPELEELQYLKEESKPKIKKELSVSKKKEKELKKKVLLGGDKKKRRFGKKVLTTSLVVSLAVGGLMSQKMFSLKVQGQEHAERAYAYMQAGQDALSVFDTKTAEENFLKAKEEFEEIEQKFRFFGRDVVNLSASLPVQSELTSVAHLVRAGKLYSLAGYEASHALSSLSNANYSIDAGDNSNYFTDSLVVAALGLKEAGEYLKEANMEVSHVRPQDIPNEFEKDIRQLQSKAGEIEALFEETLSSLDILLAFLGHESQKNYLLTFQNNSELRATGGFIGTYGILSVNKGNIKELFIDGIYNPDGQLKVNEFFVVPPDPLQYVTPYWGTRDANWFFDFPTSAEKIIWFYQKTGGPPPGETSFSADFDVHGVIALNTNILTKLLKLSGPIEMEAYGTTLTSENWLELVQKEVEQDYDKELNRPKQILADMTPILMERLGAHDKKIDLINIFIESLERKDILVYSRDERVNNFLAEQNWDGAILSSSNGENNVIEDYLAVVMSNIGGWKTDIYTDTEVDTVTKISESGDIIRTVLISRKHNGGSAPYMWYNKPNHGYVRVYAPEGSEFISAEGFQQAPRYIETDYEGEGYIKDPLVTSINSTAWTADDGTDIFEESGKTVFGNWLWIPAGERVFATVTYKLPFKIEKDTDGYELYIQKQSGLDIKYSGSIEEFDSALDLDSCGRDEESFGGAQFKFIQDSDTVIRCELVR
ncbi:MAG: DUF4012 domain-containing protein [Candidatus Spechtbacterales bacterium]